jgi:tetratricopeptide (TPR) repeat protein/SAM-dependent methyltransferase
VNRKARRAAGKSGNSSGGQRSTPSSGSWVDQLLALAHRHAEAGQVAEAESLYRKVLVIDPRQVTALHGLGQVACMTGRNAVALDLFEQAIAVDDRIPELHYSMAAALHALGRLPQAAAHCAKATQLRPDFAEAWFGLGNVLAAQGQFAEASAQFQRAIAARPDYPEALSNLGGALCKLGRTDEAKREWRRATALAPGFALPYVNLAAALADEGLHEQAITHYRHALALAPDNAEAIGSLAKSYAATGDLERALDNVRRAMAIRDTREARLAFIWCLNRFQLNVDAPGVRDLVARALSGPWERLHLLAVPVAELLKTRPAIAGCLSRVAKAWPGRLQGEDLWPTTQRTAVCNGPLLRLLLESTPICDLDLERFLTSVRSALLEEAEAAVAHRENSPTLEFYCALARQCFINDYVYAAGDDEVRRVAQLRASLQTGLDSGAEIPALWLVAVAAYGPLHSLPQAAALSARVWPPAVKDLLVQQVHEPQQEASLRASIPQLTAIDNAVSLAVREQYEANPYPSWVRMPADAAPDTVEGYLRGLFPASDFRCTPDGGGSDILVAGCGTGQHAIGVALRFKGARVLAIDLSLTSLAYAKRQAQAMGLSQIDFAQADILGLRTIARTFDVIETAGVLHHLDDPMEGWRALLSLLRPGGFMYVALYSELGRQPVAALRTFIAERGYQRTADDIRRFRQDLWARDHGLELGSLATSPDFFSTSGCRDLLFHAQEHRMTIPLIKTFLRDNDLKLIGFQLDEEVRERLHRRFPENDASADLDLLHNFETENPQTFSAMYHFWIQKVAQRSD